MKTTRWMGRIGLLVMALMALTLQAAHVQVDFADFGRSSLTNRYITFSLQGMNLLNSQLISSESLRQRTDTNGVTTFSNCIAGLYKLDAASTPASFWWIHVPDTNGVISAASNAVANPVVYPGNVVAYTKAQVDALIAAVDTGGGGGSATNVYFTSGQSTTPRTVSGSNTFDVTGTLTNYTRNYSAGISNNAADSVNVVFQSANRLVFNDPTGGEQAHYVWGRAGTSLGSQDSFWWNPDLNFSWLSFFSHPFMGVGFNDDRVLIEWNYDESNVITNHIYGTNTSITIDGRYRGAGLSLTSTETNSSLTGGVLASDANGQRKIAALSGLAWDGTTLTASGSGSGGSTEYVIAGQNIGVATNGSTYTVFLTNIIAPNYLANTNAVSNGLALLWRDGTNYWGSPFLTLTEVLANGADANGVEITALGAPTAPGSAARLADVTAAAGAWTNVTTIQTNATTAEIQSAFNAGGTIWFTPSLYPYVMSTNVYLTNGAHVMGNGALIQAAAGVTNFVWTTRTNTPNGRLIIEDLDFDGGIRNNFGDNVNYFRLVNGTPTLFYNPYYSNRSGLFLASSAGGAVKNCRFFGWSGNGVIIANPNVGQSHAGKRVEFVNNIVYSNFCGLYLAGAEYETAGYYNNPSPWQLANAEYQSVRGNQFFRNYTGLAGGAANAHVQNNFFDDNQIGFHQGAAPTSGGHGLVQGNTFNHNIYGGWAESCQLGQWKLNNFLGNTAAGFIGGSITELQFEGNYLGAAADKVIITNVCTGTVRNNRYQNTWATCAWVITNTVTVCGNTSITVAGDNDGATCVNSNVTITGTFTGNGSGITNLQFAPTAISLGGTNAAMLSNMVSTLIVSTNVLFTNWPAMAVAGYWGRTILTNSQPNNELIYVPTNMMPHNLTNSVGCYVVLDNTGTNWACTLTNLRTAELVWSAWGGNVNSMHAYFRHW